MPKKTRVVASTGKASTSSPVKRRAGVAAKPPSVLPVKDRTGLTRWGGHSILFRDGFVIVPATFLRYAARMTPYPLRQREIVFVLQLMVYKWDAKKPYPSYDSIAKAMGCSTAYARRTARELGVRNYLERVVRRGRTNQFDLQPLFDKFASYLEGQERERAARPKPVRSKAGVIMAEGAD